MPAATAKLSAVSVAGHVAAIGGVLGSASCNGVTTVALSTILNTEVGVVRTVGGANLDGHVVSGRGRVIGQSTAAATVA